MAFHDHNSYDTLQICYSCLILMNFHLIHERNSLFMSDIAIIHLYLTLRQVDEMTS